jgi:hypothetical protein
MRRASGIEAVAPPTYEEREGVKFATLTQLNDPSENS